MVLVSQVESAAVASFVGPWYWMCVQYTHHCKFMEYASKQWEHVQYCFRGNDLCELAMRHGACPKVQQRVA